jgi:hypothetical protein
MEWHRDVRRDFSDLVRSLLGDFPNLGVKSKRNQAKMRLLASRLRIHQSYEDGREKGGIVSIGSKEIIVNLLGYYSPIQGGFILGHPPNEFKFPVHINVGEKLFPNQKFYLAKEINNHASSFYGKPVKSEDFVFPILSLCNEYARDYLRG